MSTGAWERERNLSGLTNISSGCCCMCERVEIWILLCLPPSPMIPKDSFSQPPTPQQKPPTTLLLVFLGPRDHASRHTDLMLYEIECYSPCCCCCKICQFYIHIYYNADFGGMGKIYSKHSDHFLKEGVNGPVTLPWWVKM